MKTYCLEQLEKKVDLLMRELVIKELLEWEEWTEGGSFLHIVTDDGNLTDGDIQWCLDQVKEKIASGKVSRYSQELYAKGMRLAERLLSIPLEQRELAYDDYINRCNGDYFMRCYPK